MFHTSLRVLLTSLLKCGVLLILQGFSEKQKKTNLDSGNATGNQLLGRGKAVRSKHRRDIVAAVRDFISKSRPEGWGCSDVTQQCRNMRACGRPGRGQRGMHYVWQGAHASVILCTAQVWDH